MTNTVSLLAFRLDDCRFALYLSVVERVIRVVDIVPLPKAPDIVMGIINFHGRVTPVLNIRKRFSFKDRPVGLNDHLITAHTSKRAVSILADEVTGIIRCPEEKIVQPSDVLKNMEHVEGIVRLEDGMVLIHDIDKFLSLEEDERLGRAIEEI